MRFFADRARDRPIPESDRPDSPPARTIGPTHLASILHDVAKAIAQRSDSAPAPAALATVLTVLWSRFHTFDSADAHWPDRDRFVMSHPDGTPLLYSLLHLTGHAGMDQATLDHCGDLDAVATAAAEYGRHAAIEVSSAPAGQAIAAAVGMALAERLLAARFGKSLVDHRVWGVARADELTRGLADEVAALAGAFRLDRLVLLVDATGAASEDARARYAGLGWAAKLAKADDPGDIEAALSFALRSRKPTLVWCVAGAPSRMRQQPAPADAWRRIGARSSAKRRAWLKRSARHPQRAEFKRCSAGRLRDGWQEQLNVLRTQLRSANHPMSAADLCLQAIDRLAMGIPELLCASSDVTLPGTGWVEPGQYSGQYSGRYIGFGTRSHGMAGSVNGIALHAGILPVVVASLIDAAEQLPALRLAALFGRRAIYVLLDPGLSVAGRAWVPAGLLPALRAIPDLHVFRPGCPLEAAECLELAIRRSDGPSLLILSNDPVPSLRTDDLEHRCARGGYVVTGTDRPRHATLIATGAELSVAIAAGRLLAAQGVAAAVVSMPCVGLFCGQDQAYREEVLGTAPRFAIEAGGRDGWDRWIGPGGTFIGGEVIHCGPAAAIRRRLGLTPDLIAGVVLRQLGCTGIAASMAADLLV